MGDAYWDSLMERFDAQVAFSKTDRTILSEWISFYRGISKEMLPFIPPKERTGFRKRIRTYSKNAVARRDKAYDEYMKAVEVAKSKVVQH